MDGLRVFVLEDSLLMAEAIEDLLSDAGAAVVGTPQSVAAALDLLATQSVDFACLDIDLGKEDSFPVADELLSRRIPFIFVTGSDAEVVPQRHRNQTLVRKMDMVA